MESHDKVLKILFDKDEITWQSIIYELIKTGDIDPWDVNISLLTKRYIETVKKLEKKLPVELELMENIPHEKCMEIKSRCDIYIDQIADKGGWGYGMSSVEAMAQGLATCTYLNEKYMEFIPDNGFINVNYDNLEPELERLVTDSEYRKKMQIKGRQWVVKIHDIKNVISDLYGYYKLSGIIN